MQVGDLIGIADKVQLRTDAALPNTNLAVTSADEGTVKLTGKVDSVAPRDRASMLAQTTAWVKKVEQAIAIPEGK